MVEILIAVSIITVSILAVMAVAQKSVYISRESLHVAQAEFLLEEGAEVARILRDNAWSNISSLTAGTYYYPAFSSNTWNLSSNDSAVGIFTRTLSIADVRRDIASDDISNAGANDSGTKLITITVSWPEGGTIVTKILSFYLTNIFS